MIIFLFFIIEFFKVSRVIFISYLDRNRQVAWKCFLHDLSVLKTFFFFFVVDSFGTWGCLVENINFYLLGFYEFECRKE